MTNSWIFPAVLSALFAALTAILAKIGVMNVSSNLATAIRTTVILFFAWGIVLFQGLGSQLTKIEGKTLVFLVLSGIATGLSWLFYFRALQLGDASKVAPVDKLSLVFTVLLAFMFLRERISMISFVGILITTIGIFIVIFGK